MIIYKEKRNWLERDFYPKNYIHIKRTTIITMKMEIVSESAVDNIVSES